MKKNNPSLKLERIISLPINVETHVISVAWIDTLWILINVSAKKETVVFKLNNTFTFKKIISLPLLSTTATLCDEQLIISGADRNGKPLIIAITKTGTILWKHAMDITPVIWPIASCKNNIFVAWQENMMEIESGNLNLKTNKIEKFPKINVENPPAIFFTLKKDIFASLSNKNKTSLINLTSNEVYLFDTHYPLAVGEIEDDFYVAWQETNSVCLKFQKKVNPFCFPIKNASLGNLKAISGKVATLWLQTHELSIGDDYYWKTAIIRENTNILEIDGFIFCITFWRNRLVVIQNSKMILYKENTN